MKFFTKERFEELQVVAYLVYLDNEKAYNIEKEHYAGRDSFYKEAHWQDFLRRKPLMMKYLPQSIRRGVCDESIKPFLKLPHLDLLEEIKEWRHNVRSKSEDTLKEYKKYYETIKNYLPENIVNLHENYNFHDAKILLLTGTNDNRILELGYGEESHSLTFVAVKLLVRPNDIIGDCWIYDEVHLAEEGKFELRVLLHAPKGFLTLHELRIVYA